MGSISNTWLLDAPDPGPQLPETDQFLRTGLSAMSGLTQTLHDASPQPTHFSLAHTCLLRILFTDSFMLILDFLRLIQD